jgi:hypothetical protein
MAGFADLIPAAMPYLATEQLSGAQGSSWEWSYECTDDLDAPVPWTNCTGTAVLKSTLTGAVALTLTVTFPADGVVTVTATSALTAPLAPGAYLHEVEVTNSALTKTIKIVGGGDARFTVKPQVTV